MHYLRTHLPATFIANKMARNALIEQAIDDLISQKKPNVAATAKKYNIVRTTLMRRYKGQTSSAEEARSRSTQLLTNTQEKVIVEYLNKLSDRGFHPSPQILENLVTEVVGHPIGGRWQERFCKRHKNVLKSIYLRGIDHVRVVADNSKYFQHYFASVNA